MDDQKILDNAPKNWPVADEIGMLNDELVYISNSDNGYPFKVYCAADNGKAWIHSEDDADFAYIRNRRSLADVKRIVELRNAKAELEKERDSWRRVSEKLEEQKVNLISSGTKISNLAYNLKQDAELPKFVRNSLESSQKEWDETVSISKALKVGE
jgi:3'-phosphoadenosine 5'-phosphosulfate (PAPS) 3'-phosphatase